MKSIRVQRELLGCEDVRNTVDAVLWSFLGDKEHNAEVEELSRSAQLLGQFLKRGKRLRPLFCVIGWHIGSEEEPSQSIYGLGAALELFHAFALIHDDIMDDSDTRRGRPTMHRILSADSPTGLSESQRHRYGLNTAILVGDLAMAWSDELLVESLTGQPTTPAVLALVAAMRAELMVGQFRDLRAAGSSGTDLATALDTIRRKTTSYTVDYPLRLGATLADASDSALAACSAYAVPLGEAFQLRDDLLGLFGDPGRTGKSVTDDLRAGKATVLMALALRAATPAQRNRLHTLVGNESIDPAGVDTVRGILRETGAVSAVEQMILARRDEALAALDSGAFPAGPRILLRELAVQATDRET